MLKYGFLLTASYHGNYHASVSQETVILLLHLIANNSITHVLIPVTAELNTRHVVCFIKPRFPGLICLLFETWLQTNAPYLSVPFVLDLYMFCYIDNCMEMALLQTRDLRRVVGIAQR